jgi:hypothetical protein
MELKIIYKEISCPNVDERDHNSSRFIGRNKNGAAKSGCPNTETIWT